MSLLDYLNEAYELDLWKYPGVRFTHEPIEEFPEGLPEDFSSMVKIDKVDDEGVHWDVNLDEYEGLFGSVTSGSKTVRHGEKYKYRHEFVCETIQMGKSDAKLKLIKTLSDDDDFRTPDFIIFSEDNSVIHVIEITTVKYYIKEVIHNAYKTKEFSYLSALENRIDNNIITYTIIVVTPNSVLSSIALPNLMIVELVARMRLGLCLERCAEMISLDLEDDERTEFKKSVSKNIKLEISKIDYRIIDENPLIIDNEYRNLCMTASNENEVVKTFVKELEMTRIEVEEKYNLISDEEIGSFINKFKDGNRRSDKKMITTLPLICIDEQIPSSEIPRIPINHCDELKTVSKLWSVAMDIYELSPHKEIENPESLLNEALSEDIGEIKLFQELRKEKRRKYHRVDLKDALNEEDLESLAMQGLWGKKYKNDDFMKSRRLHQQSAFSWNTDTTDIEDFLKDGWGLDQSKNLIDEDERLKLLNHANMLTENNDEGVITLTEWMQTKLFQSMDIISDIAYEVAISNKQHCKPKEMIMKKLRRYEIYLLISPTNSSEHTFVSVYVPNHATVKYSGIFGRMFKCIGGYVSDFFSIKQGKLENQSSMPSALISLASFWAWFYDLESANPNSFKNNHEAFYMLKFSLLLRLEDKAQTEETVTMTRYMYMEIFKSFFSVTSPEPFKILEKINTYPRSRLNLFCIKKIVLNFSKMIKDPPTRVNNYSRCEIEEGEDSVPNDYWEGLLNWVSGNNVSTASKAINLVYLGYLKNKMEPPEGNTDLQLVEKTCEEEFKLDWTQIHKSKGECKDRPKPKQFNLNNIKHGSEVLISRLKNMLGEQWQDILEKDIIDTLSNKMTLEVATLKASANIDHNSVNEKGSLSNNIGAGRKKVIESTFEHLDELGINPIMKINGILEKIENSSKGVICDLFKKQQHGGLREIYVLTIESRILQLYIETISRVICSYFEEETLTHPRNKLRKLDEHRSNTARISSRDNSIYADFCSSTDKTRWNQNLVMPAMAIPLFKILPTFFHNSIMRILNLWTLKLIKLPQRVINLLINSTQMKSETFHKLLQEFWNPTTHSPFLVKNGKFIRLNSGMMQGILHYTSSLLHLTFLNSMNKIIPKLLHNSFPNHSFLITQVCSSDDSATILSVFSPKNSRTLTKETYRVCKKSSQILETLNNMAPYYCMKNSVKSTTGLVDYVEFNSEFLFRNTIAIPIIKFVAASLNLTETESFLERFHTMYNLISDLFSSGFPAYNTYLCQLAQGLNHYKTMGYSVNPLFEVWSSGIVKVPDPILGFFLLDSSFCPGVLGYSFSYWKATLNSSILRRSIKATITEATEVIDGGGIVQSLILKYGDVKRWKQLSAKLSKNIDFRNIIEQNPEILFREPRTRKELEVSLAIKATMPSVAKSMRRGNPYMQALAMSVYAINTHCFSKTTVTQDLTGKLSRETQKISLLKEINNRIEELKEPTSEMSNEVLEITFPAVNRYREADKIIRDFKEKHEQIQCSKFRHRRTEVFVQPYSTFVPLSLMQTFQALWFGYKVRTSKSIFMRCVQAYKIKIPWLKDSIHDTLLESPFNTYQELVNFISSHTIRSRTFVRVGPALNSKRFTGQLYNLIRKSYKSGFVLKSRHSPSLRHPKEYVGTAETISRLSLALSLPTKKLREQESIRILTTSPRLYDNIENVQKMSKRDANLAYIQGFLKNEFSAEDITTSIQQTGNGLLFAYTKVQEKIETEKGVKWMGEGVCFVHSEKSLICITMLDDKAIKIEVSNWRIMKANPSTMSMILRELKLKPQNEPRSRRGKFVARFDGEHWVTTMSLGTPVYEVDFSPRYRDVRDVKVTIGFQSINMTQFTPKGPASMIRFKTYPGDVLLNPSAIIGNKAADCWVNQKTFNDVYAMAFIMSKESEEPETKHWIKETLTARLSHKGLTKGLGELSHWIPFIDTPQQIQEVEISDECLEELHKEMNLEGEVLLSEDYDKLALELPKRLFTEGEDLQEEYEEDFILEEGCQGWGFVMHNWAVMEIEENVDITSKGVKTFKYLHPFWDSMIDSIEKEHRGFWEKTYSGYLTSGFEEFGKKIMNILDLQTKGKPIGLEERAKLLITEVVSEFREEPSASRQASIERDDSPSWYEEAENGEEDMDDFLL